MSLAGPVTTQIRILTALYTRRQSRKWPFLAFFTFLHYVSLIYVVQVFLVNCHCIIFGLWHLMQVLCCQWCDCCCCCCWYWGWRSCCCCCNIICQYPWCGLVEGCCKINISGRAGTFCFFLRKTKVGGLTS